MSEDEAMKKAEADFYAKHPVPPWRVVKFEDRPEYCRVPIYIAGERQVHIMQTFDKKKQEAGPEPKNLDEWFKLLEKNGQVVVSFEALDDFCAALLKFRGEQRKITGG